MNKFKQGDIVQSNTEIVLVTGSGNFKVAYPCFSGVVIKKLQSFSDFDAGFYSKTWDEEAFGIMNAIISVRSGTYVTKSKSD